MRGRKLWAPSKDVTVDRVERTSAGTWVVFGSLAQRGICPGCGSRSRRRHGWRRRRLQDFPAQGQAVTIDLRVCRWRCMSRGCRSSTFSDQAPTVADPRARRTSRIAQIVEYIGHAAGGRPAERLMHRLSIPVSDDTILRVLKRKTPTKSLDLRAVGIDDWSWRKSTRYGTIMVDLERRCVVDVLEDRSVESCTEWLRNHPSIEIVSRDRCGLYSRAARDGAPQALQVADRFHLIQNLRTAIEEQVNMSGRMTGRAILSDAENASAARHLRSARLAHRRSREEVFRTIHVLRKEGLSYSEIERRTGFKRRSVAKWLAFETPPDRRRATPTPRSPRYFEDYLAQRWKEGHRTGRALFHDVKKQGYTGSFSNLERLLGAWRRVEKPTPKSQAHPLPKQQPVRDPETGHLISPIIAAALCIKPRGLLTVDQARKVDALKEGSDAFATMRSLAMRFKGILRGGHSEPLDQWIDDAIETGLIPIVRFASVLRRDLDAVRNAIELPWSNGQAEGQINRLKTLKRAMYGRAGAELLKARMLPLRHTK